MLPPRRAPFVRVILLAGFVAGTLDISDALIFYGARFHLAPIRILQSIAGHVLGRSAYAEGYRSALLGLLIHYLIATTWAALFIFVARKIPTLNRNAVISGVLYGLLVYVVMNYAVLPLTLLNTPPSRNPVVLLNAVLALVFCIGLPIALLSRSAAKWK